MEETIIGIIGAVIGFAVSRWYTVAESRDRAHARLQALRAEILECGARAHSLRQAAGDSIVGYVLPDWIGRDAVGTLAADGLFGELDAQALVQFYALVADANRNLDYSRASDRGIGGIMGVLLAAQKANHLFDEENGVSLLQRAQAVVTSAIEDVAGWRWWHPFMARRLR